MLRLMHLYVKLSVFWRDRHESTHNTCLRRRSCGLMESQEESVKVATHTETHEIFFREPREIIQLQEHLPSEN